MRVTREIYHCLSIVLLLSTCCAASAQDKAPRVRNIVLVHGAWADGSSWNAVSTALQGDGFTVLTPPNLLRGVAADAEYVSSFLAQRTVGPVVLVGHSYGGVVITNAAEKGGDVKALVYVNAFIPDVGENVFTILGGSGSALDVPDPTSVLDLGGYPGSPEGDVEAFLRDGRQ